MKQNLQNKLYKFFPKIFVQKDLPKEQTCMCWGIECPDEWYDPLYNLCETIQEYVDFYQKPQIQAVQVKSKFGKLCFYTNYQDPYVQGAIAVTQQNIKQKETIPVPANYLLNKKEIKELRKGKKKLSKFALKELRKKI